MASPDGKKHDVIGTVDASHDNVCYPGNVEQLSTATLTGMLCRRGTEFDGCEVEKFSSIDVGLMGKAGNSFAGSLVGVTVVVVRRPQNKGRSGVTDDGHNNIALVDGDDARREEEEQQQQDDEDGVIMREEVHLALKFPPKDKQQKKMVCEWFSFFPREVEMYSAYFPAVEAFLDSHCQKSAARWRHLLPKCYFAASETSGPSFDACIALMDLRVQEYHPRRLIDGASEDDCRLILHHLAFMHAASACFFAENPGFSSPQRLRYANVDPFSSGDGKSVDHMLGEQKRIGYARSLQFVYELTQKTGLLDPTELERLKAVIDGVADLHAGDAYKTKRGPLLVNHGDFTLCNVMTTRTGDVKFIDFQMAQVGDLMVDLILFLYTSLKTPQARQLSLAPLLRAYHQQFLHCVSQLGFDSRVTYPYDDFAQDFADKCFTFGVPRLGFALFLNLATREDFEAAGAGGSVVAILDAVGARARKGDLNGAKSAPLTSVIIELMRMKPENVK